MLICACFVLAICLPILACVCLQPCTRFCAYAFKRQIALNLRKNYNSLKIITPHTHNDLRLAWLKARFLARFYAYPYSLMSGRFFSIAFSCNSAFGKCSATVSPTTSAFWLSALIAFITFATLKTPVSPTAT